MNQADLRRSLYFALCGLRGQALGAHYKRFVREEQQGIPADTTRRLLIRLLAHCKQHVPYYAALMREAGDSFYDDPEEYLKTLPILTKGTLRTRFEELKSSDLPRRRWFVNSTGGSTGEPARFIQDWDYATQTGAITLLFFRLAGREVGEPEVRIWGSTRDIAEGTEGWRPRLANWLANTTFLNAFRMTPGTMREFIDTLNAERPKLVVSYVGPMYELARFAEREGLYVAPQAAIMTSGGTLYPFMRQAIERVFHCKIINRYGSREMSNIACERPGMHGLWVAPWGCYVEVVDNQGNRLPNGTEGELLVTSLANLAMPLVRYRIGDRGVLSPLSGHVQVGYAQVLEGVLGRTHDLFPTKDGGLVDAGYFMHLLYFRDWIARYQVIQKSPSSIVFRIVTTGSGCTEAELEEISRGTRLIMGDDCQIAFEWVREIAACESGKYRFIISEVQR